MDNFKVEDWVYYEFELGQIQKMEGNDITDFSDGIFHKSARSLNDRTFPLNMRIKVISDYFERVSIELHNLQNNDLNYPSIHGRLVSLWLEACSTPNNKKGNDELDSIYSKLRDFKDKIVIACRDVRSISADGVRIFGR
jgi:hypothetical protein